MKDKTIQNIREVFLKQLENSPVEKITVTSVCKDAHINRGTFYRYFHDVYELLEDIENSLLKEISDYTKLLADSEISDEKAVLSLLEIFKKNNAVFKSIHDNTENTAFGKKIYETVYEPFLTVFEKRIDSKYSDNLLYLYHYCISGAISVIVSWIRSGSKESATEIYELIKKIEIFGLSSFS